MATKMADKMYGNAPKLERDDADGKVKIKKSEKPKEEKEGEAEGGEPGAEKNDVESRHTMDRAELHMKHQREHMMHKGGDKKEMNSRHLKEHEDMMKRHEKELGGEKK